MWQDMAGLRTGRMPRFVKQYADLHGVLLDAAQAFAADVGRRHVPRTRAHVLTKRLLPRCARRLTVGLRWMLRRW